MYMPIKIYDSVTTAASVPYYPQPKLPLSSSVPAFHGGSGSNTYSPSVTSSPRAGATNATFPVPIVVTVDSTTSNGGDSCGRVLADCTWCETVPYLKTCTMTCPHVIFQKPTIVQLRSAGAVNVKSLAEQYNQLPTITLAVETGPHASNYRDRPPVEEQQLFGKLRLPDSVDWDDAVAEKMGSGGRAAEPDEDFLEEEFWKSIVHSRDLERKRGETLARAKRMEKYKRSMARASVSSIGASTAHLHSVRDTFTPFSRQQSLNSSCTPMERAVAATELRRELSAAAAPLPSSSVPAVTNTSSSTTVNRSATAKGFLRQARFNEVNRLTPAGVTPTGSRHMGSSPKHVNATPGQKTTTIGTPTLTSSFSSCVVSPSVIASANRSSDAGKTTAGGSRSGGRGGKTIVGGLLDDDAINGFRYPPMSLTSVSSMFPDLTLSVGDCSNLTSTMADMITPGTARTAEGFTPRRPLYGCVSTPHSKEHRTGHDEHDTSSSNQAPLLSVGVSKGSRVVPPIAAATKTSSPKHDCASSKIGGVKVQSRRQSTSTTALSQPTVPPGAVAPTTSKGELTVTSTEMVLPPLALPATNASIGSGNHVYTAKAGSATSAGAASSGPQAPRSARSVTSQRSVPMSASVTVVIAPEPMTADGLKPSSRASSLAVVANVTRSTRPSQLPVNNNTIHDNSHRGHATQGVATSPASKHIRQPPSTTTQSSSQQSSQKNGKDGDVTREARGATSPPRPSSQHSHHSPPGQGCAVHGASKRSEACVGALSDACGTDSTCCAPSSTAGGFKRFPVTSSPRTAGPPRTVHLHRPSLNSRGRSSPQGMVTDSTGASSSLATAVATGAIRSADASQAAAAAALVGASGEGTDWSIGDTAVSAAAAGRETCEGGESSSAGQTLANGDTCTRSGGRASVPLIIVAPRRVTKAPLTETHRIERDVACAQGGEAVALRQDPDCGKTAIAAAHSGGADEHARASGNGKARGGAKHAVVRTSSASSKASNSQVGAEKGASPSHIPQKQEQTRCCVVM